MKSASRQSSGFAVKYAAAALLLAGTASFLAAGTAQAGIQATGGRSPALVITNDPLPPDLHSRIYSKPARAPEISPSQLTGGAYYGDGGETVVSRKVGELRGDLAGLQGKVAKLSQALSSIEADGQRQAAEYYASVATISTQLQSGTTPGNPRLVKKLSVARDNLEKLSGNIAALNDMALEISNAASLSTFMLESARAAYSLTGAVEEDHIQLAQLEDAVNGTVVVIDRLLNNVNDDITRTVAYLSTERENLRTLSLAITKGDLFGKSLSNRPFSDAALASFTPQATTPRYPGMDSGMNPADLPQGAIAPSMAAPMNASMSGMAMRQPRPLVKIRFDRPDVSYEQPVYMAVNEALARYPNARFELVAVHPGTGNAAQVAIESTRARRNAERVLRSLTQMGLSTNQVDLSYAPSQDATSSEVHLYIR